MQDDKNRLGTSRREFIALGVGAFAVATIPFVRNRARLVRRSVPVMGTIAEAAVVHRDAAYAQGAIDAAFQRLRNVEATLTRFDDRSDVGRANLFALDDAVVVSRATAQVLHAALGWAGATDGVFDPCLGRVMELWDLGRRTTPPEQEAVRRLAGRRLYRTLDVDTRAGRPVVRLTDRDSVIDLGGIGKGYGVDEAVRVLRDWDIADAIVNVGGDLYAMGKSEDGNPWRIGIRSPDDLDKTVATFDVEDSAVATSGDYLQYFQYGGRRYHHLLDPRTGEPRRSAMRSLTVSAPDCMNADAAATAGFGQPGLIAEATIRSARVIHTI